MPLTSVRVVAVDQPARRQRRADRARFPVGSDPSDPVRWLSCPDESALPGIDFSLPRTPNLAVTFTRPVPLGPNGAPVRGFLAAMTDADAARAAFVERGVSVRSLNPADLAGIRTVPQLPVHRLGPGGLREVRSSDRIRA